MNDIKILLKKKKNPTNMVVKTTKIYQEMKSKSFLSIEKFNKMTKNALL